MIYQTLQPKLEKKVVYMDASIYINLIERDIETLEQINEKYYILYSLPIKKENRGVDNYAPRKQGIVAPKNEHRQYVDTNNRLL